MLVWADLSGRFSPLRSAPAQMIFFNTRSPLRSRSAHMLWSFVSLCDSNMNYLYFINSRRFTYFPVMGQHFGCWSFTNYGAARAVPAVWLSPPMDATGPLVRRWSAKLTTRSALLIYWKYILARRSDDYAEGGNTPSCLVAILLWCFRFWQNRIFLCYISPKMALKRINKVWSFAFVNYLHSGSDFE